MAEAVQGQRWATDGQQMVPQVTKLVVALLTMTKATVSPRRIRECWPILAENVPWQSTEGIRAKVVAHLAEDATCMLSLTVWDMFTFPEEPEHWQEDYLSYIPGEEVNVGARMLGLCLITTDAVGQYDGCTHILLYEGQMLAHNLASNLAWVPMCGVSSALTAVEVKSACDLSSIVPCPHLGDTSQTGESARPFWGL